MIIRIIRKEVFFCLMICFCNAGYLIAQPAFAEYPVPLSDRKSPVFTVTIDKNEIFTTAYKDISYIYFEQLKPVVLTISIHEKINEYEVSPQHNMRVKLSGNQLQITCKDPGYFVVKINKKNSLFVFSEKAIREQVAGENRNVVNIMDYQVDNTGKILETEKLQQALNDISEKNRTLFFPPGIYKTGTLQILSNSKVFLAAGAILKGSEKAEDYPDDASVAGPGNSKNKRGKGNNGEFMTFSRMILIDNAKNVKVWGRGIIDGNGAVIRKQGKPANLIRIRNSSNITIEGLMLRDPAAWNTHILYSRHVQMNDVKIINDRDTPNTDGIDPDASQDVTVSHCFAYCSDDNIAIKSTNNSNLLQDVRNITIRDCVFLTKKSSLKIGTETKSARISDVIFKNNQVVEADRGISLYCYDGAGFENIQFLDNRFINGFADSQQKAIHIEIRNRSGKGFINNVLFKNCLFETTFHAASLIKGLDSTHLVSNIVFENTRLGDKVCLSAAAFNLKTNSFTRGIIFKK